MPLLCAERENREEERKRGRARVVADHLVSAVEGLPPADHVVQCFTHREGGREEEGKRERSSVWEMEQSSPLFIADAPLAVSSLMLSLQLRYWRRQLLPSVPSWPPPSLDGSRRDPLGKEERLREGSPLGSLECPSLPAYGPLPSSVIRGEGSRRNGATGCPRERKRERRGEAISFERDRERGNGFN